MTFRPEHPETTPAETNPAHIEVPPELLSAPAGCAPIAVPPYVPIQTWNPGASRITPTEIIIASLKHSAPHVDHDARMITWLMEALVKEVGHIDTAGVRKWRPLSDDPNGHSIVPGYSEARLSDDLST